MDRIEKKKNGLRVIPGVGPSMENDLQRMGYRLVSDLKGQDPQEMYERLMDIEGCHVDRCVLYVFRCAVYYAQTPLEEQETEKLKWWNWKD